MNRLEQYMARRIGPENASTLQEIVRHLRADKHECEDRLAERQRLAEKIEQRRCGRTIYVYQGGRDCDMCESSHAYRMPASVMMYERRRGRMYEWAEGPCSMHIMTKCDYLDFQPTSRDLALEALEDGHPHIVYA